MVVQKRVVFQSRWAASDYIYPNEQVWSEAQGGVHLWELPKSLAPAGGSALGLGVRRSVVTDGRDL